MTILLSDPRVAAVPVLDAGEPLVALGAHLGPARALVRAGLAARLDRAALELPDGIHLRVVEGHRDAAVQQAIITRYAAEVCAARPGVGPRELHELTSRFVAPLAVAPHVAGAAVDLTLVDAAATSSTWAPRRRHPGAVAGRCYLASTAISAAARARRDLLAGVLDGAGLVNYPTEWWHWSYGDRYWALLTGAPAALHGPVSPAVVAA